MNNVVQEESTLNEFWDAITEIVQSNNDYMTPSPAEPDLDSPDHTVPQKFTYDIYLDPAVAADSYRQHSYYYMSDQEKIKSQNVIDSIFNKGHMPVKSEISHNFPQNDMPGMDHMSFLQSLIQHGNIHESINDAQPHTPSTYSESYHEEDEDEDDEKEDEKLILNVEFNDPSYSENKSEINDNELTQLSVRDLNRRLKNLPKDERQKLKQRRRLLKNRGYAQTCRTRRINTQKTLYEENQQLKELLQKTNIEKNVYKTKYENLKTLIKKAKMEREKKKESFQQLC